MKYLHTMVRISDVDKSLDFRPLHQALRDPERNFLYGYLGLAEDDPKNKAAIDNLSILLSTRPAQE